MQKWVWSIGLLCLLVILGILFFPSGYFTNLSSPIDDAAMQTELTAQSAGGSASGERIGTSSLAGLTDTEGNRYGNVSDATDAASQAASAEVQLATRQDYWITGYSQDDQSQGLEGTAITVFELQRGRGRVELIQVESNKDGYFAVELDKPGIYRVVAKPQTEEFSIEEADIVFDASKTFVAHHFIHTSATASIQGKVIDAETKKPVEGAVVSLGPDFGARETERRVNRPAPSAKSDEQGQFTIRRISPGAYSLKAVAKGYEERSYHSWEEAHPLANLRIGKDTVITNAVVELSPGGSVIVRVFDPQGKRLEKAQVEVVVQKMNSSTMGITDESGEWRSDTIRKGKAVAQVKHNDYGLTVSDAFDTGTVEEPAIVELTMLEPASVSGHVSYQDGRTGAEFELIIRSLLAEERINSNAQLSFQMLPTDESGNYLFDNLGEGPHQIQVHKRSAGGYSNRDTAASKNIDLKAGEKLTGVDFVVEDINNESVKGKVVDQDGTPLEAILVQAHIYDPAVPDGTPGKHRTSHTDENGEFEITGLIKVPKFHFAIWAEGYEKLSQDLPMDGEYLNITLKGGGILSGLVRDRQKQQPLPNVELMLYSLSDLNFREKATMTGPDGTFRFPTQAPGSYRIVAQEKDHTQAELTDVRVDFGKGQENLLIEMEQGMNFQGQLIGSNGQPAAGAGISLLSHRKEGSKPFSHPDMVQPLSIETQSDENGFFTIQIDPSKQDMLAIQSRIDAPMLYPVSGSSLKPEPEPIQLTPGATIEGGVWDEQGNPLRGVTLFSFDEPQMLFIQSTSTNDEGKYRFEHLTPGKTVVLKSGRGGSDEREFRQTVLREGETTEVNFGNDDGATVKGVITQYNTPRGGAIVIIQNIHQHVFQSSIVSDGDGTYSFKGVPAGTYQVMASLPENDNASMLYFADASRKIDVNEEQKNYEVNLDISKGELEGVVRDANTGGTIAGAEIRPDYGKSTESQQNQYGRPAFSDEQGVFRMMLKWPGDYYYNILKAGYEIGDLQVHYERPTGGGAPSQLAAEVSLKPSEVILEAQLLYNNLPVQGLDVNFSAYPYEEVPGQTGVYRVSGLPEGSLSMMISARGGPDEVDLKERLDGLVLQKGINRAMVNLIPFVYYVLDVSTPSGEPITLEAKMLRIELPEYPKYTPPSFGGFSSGDTSFLSVAIPAGPARMRMTVEGYKPIDCIPWNLATPMSQSWRKLQLQLVK